MKRITIRLIVALVAGFSFMLVGPQEARAAPLSCDTTTGVAGAGECQITTAHAVTGAVEVDRTLHIFGNGRIDATSGGITLNVCVAPAPAFSTCDLILDTPSVVGGGQIEADDVTGNDDASPITIHVSRDLLMHSSSAILAENTHSGGHGGNIVISAGRDMTMNALATISASSSGSSGNSISGNITINVGNYPSTPKVGAFTMDPTSQILANGTSGSAGEILITAGLFMDVDGLVQSKSTLTGAGSARAGGPITLQSGCKLLVSDAGIVSSEGFDPGADLVHLEGCDVAIQGIVQSTATNGNGGHVLPTNPPNHCNLDSTAHPFPLANAAYTACVEIWANNVTIDSTGTHHGEVNADGMRTDSGGPRRAWIDIFARTDVTILAHTTGKYAVHANAPSPTNQIGGLITVKAKGGHVLTTAAVAGTKGLALQANATSAGSVGGNIVVEAGGALGSGKVDFTADSVQAIGASSGGTPGGGTITAQSFNDGVAGTAAGELNAAGGPPAGSVTLTACVGDPASTYSGTVTGSRTDNAITGCGGTSTFPTVANTITGQTVSTYFTTRAAFCDTTCGPQTCTPSGQKFNDLLGDGVKDGGDPPVAGFSIHIFDKATAGATLHQDTTTDAGGNYAFSVPPGEYIICEQGGPAPASPAQTFPAADGSGGLCATHTGVTGSRGYDIMLNVDVNGCTSTHNDFGNFFGASISGQKFNDLAGDGVKDAGDPPLAGTQIHLVNTTTLADQHTLTDAGGNFSFTAVPPGNYILCEQGGPAPHSPAQTFPASDGSGGACATHTGITGSRGYAITLTANQVSTGKDFGNFFGGTISGEKFNDLGTIGVKDPDDPPVQGVQIHLFDKATGTTVHQHVFTDVSGNYSFTVQPGTYIVCEQGGPPIQTFPTADGSGGACATHISIAGSRGYEITVTANANITGKDFGNNGNLQAPPGTVSGTKFDDLLRNGVKDPNDPPIQGVEIHLFDKATGGTTLHMHVFTDVSGNFSFTAVPPGDYIVCEQGGPPTQTFPVADGSGGLCATHILFAGSRGYTVTVFSDTDSGGNNFGNHQLQAPPPALVPTLSQFGLMALAALLALAGAGALARRRSQDRLRAR